ncbi:MAG: H(+)/Cl(-) exchange transporter ClcA [Planctomycetes bacterium]|nr:H(+)/Cl(-) exchange transporter ClcA [Planctomycetota bacterium]
MSPSLPPLDTTATEPEGRGRIAPGFLRVFAAACVVGAGAGLLAAAFRAAVERLQRVLHDGLSAWSGAPALLASMAVTATLVGVALWLVRRFAPEAAGSGVQEIEGALEGTRPVRWRRVLPVKFLGGVCALASGMVVGREGPTVQMGAQFGGLVNEVLRLRREAAHALLAAGSAAGLAAAFNAPLSGVLFVIEEMRPRFHYGFTSVQAVLVASACADVTSRAVSHRGPVFEFTAFPAPALSALWLFPLFGALLGLVGVLFNGSLIALLRGLDRLSANRRLAVGVLVGAAVGLATWAWSDVTGGGYQAITDAVALRFAIPTLLLLFALRFGATVLSYASGIPGGIFTPMLALGTLLGVGIGLGVDRLDVFDVHPAVFAIVGMGALFSSTVRAPLTGIALAIELTASFDLILPLLLACSMSTLVAEALGGRPIYELLLERSLARAPVDAAPAAE